MVGYIKDYRSELESDIWKMPPLYHRVWQYLKYKVNHSVNRIPMREGGFLVIQPGQHLTSIRIIANGIGYYEKLRWKEPNPKTISSILSWLVKQQMITIENGRGNSQYTLITLMNWSFYQPRESKGNSNVTVDGYAKKQLVDINKNDKEMLNNDKNENNNTEGEKTLLTSNIELAWTENAFLKLSVKETKGLAKWKKDLSEELVLEAIGIASKKGIRNYAYVEGILSRFLVEGLKTIEDVELSKQNRKNNIPQQSKLSRIEIVPKWFNKNENIQRETPIDSIDIETERERLKLELRGDCGSVIQ